MKVSDIPKRSTPRSRVYLIKTFEQIITGSGWSIRHLPSPTSNRCRIRMSRGEESYCLRIYIWNLTRDGSQAKSRDEFRVQITGIDRFEAEKSAKTLILGWWDEVGVFAAFDFRKHAGALGASHSIQIREEFLIRAYQDGLAPCNKGNKEIAIAVRPDFLVEYIRHLEALHSFGESDVDFRVLDAVSRDPLAVSDEVLARVSMSRQATVASVRRCLRDIGFRNRVLTACAFQCAVCGVLLENGVAAYIIPATHELCTDETNNGIALCELHHFAFERGLIGLGEDYSVKINNSEIRRLRAIHRDGGMDRFIKALRPLILLPPDVSNRPNTNYIRIGNGARGWPRDEGTSQAAL